MRIIIIGIALTLLSSCKGAEERRPMPSESFHLYESPIGYHISVPMGFKYSEFDPSSKYYYFGYPIENDTKLQTIDLNDQITSFCSSSLTGASQMDLLLNANGKAMWGKMDFYKDSGMEGWEPSSDESLLVCVGGGTPPPEAVYSFCSEKDGKTVVICINQMRDNPELAKQIFETFRWTE